MRPDKLKVMKQVAEAFAELSTCSERAKVGAVLYDYAFHIVATGYNGAPSGMDHCDDVKCELDSSGSCVRAVHAEMNALLQCAYYGVSTAGLNLLCTHSPCPRCAVALVRAGIVCVTYVNYYNGSAITARTLHEAGVQLRKYVEA